MRLTSTPMRWALVAALVLTACEADAGDDDASRSIEPVESSTVISEPAEPTDETEPGEPDDLSEPTDPSAPATPASTSSTAPPPTDVDPAPATTDLVVTPTTAKASEPPSGGAAETFYEIGMIDRGLAPFVDQAVADLAGRLEVPVEEVTVLTAVLVVWPSAALGCPEPGRSYPQLLTDGAVIELGVGGRVHRYHSGGAQEPFPCDRPLDPVPPGTAQP